MLRTLLAFLLSCAATAQTVRVANYAPHPFTGWLRTTTDTRPTHDAGTLPTGERFVLGRKIGLDVWALDVHVTLAPHEERDLRLADAAPSPAPELSLPADPVAFFGGLATVNGAPLGLVSVTPDGAGWRCRMRGRVTPMLNVDAWLRWLPDQPGMATGEVVVCCSNGSIPDMGETSDALTFRFGDAYVHVLGAGWGSPIVPAGTAFADGQARGAAVTLAWRRILGDVDEAGWFQVNAAGLRAATAVAIARLLPDGNPSYPPGFDVRAWMGQWPEALRRLHTWEAGTIGANPTAGDTGAQEDQVFVRGESLLPGGVGAEQVAYFAALKMLARPCHHLEADGSFADPIAHPNCVTWNGRPHFNLGVSPDRLGKTGVLPDTHGWLGPDREHWLYNTVIAAARLTDSAALQWELEQQARLFLFGETVRPGWSTSGPDAARSVGWAGILVVGLWRDLEDRALAARVRARYEDRVRLVYAALGTRPLAIWDVRVDDPRLGAGAWWIPWQQGVGCYGLDLAGRVLDIPLARSIALEGARAVMRDAWLLQSGRWVSSPQRPVAGTAPADEVFNYFGMGLAPAVVLRNDPADPQAGAVWAQLTSGANETKETAWLAPGVVAAPAPTASSMTQFGVTWTFAQPRPAGRFCNGDPWVVGPVTIAAITPGVVVQPTGRTTGGSMLSPAPRADGKQGYDSSLYDSDISTVNPGDFFLRDETNAPRWTPAMNVGAQLPLTITTGSLISTTPAFAPANGQWSALQTAAVLTVLAAAPSADAFRPAYAGADKTVRFREQDLDYALLADLTPAAGAPSVAEVEAWFYATLWLDHFPNWTSRYMHPQAGLGDYYQRFTRQIGDAALLANTNLTNAQKRKIVIALTQMGIDNFEHMKLGAKWGVNGHCNGRKFPILFAGRVLHDDAMLAAGTTYAPTIFTPGDARNVIPFSEDGQTFYVQETSPGVYNWGFGGYTAADVGLPEWGNFHAQSPAGDDHRWVKNPGENDYRRCCSAISWSGCVLAMRAMGLRPFWNQPAFFDYMDRYMATEQTELRAYPWQGAMWDRHRPGL